MTVQDSVQDRAFHFTFSSLLRTVIPRVLFSSRISLHLVRLQLTNQTAAKLRRFLHFDDTWETCLAYSCKKKKTWYVRTVVVQCDTRFLLPWRNKQPLVSQGLFIIQPSLSHLVTLTTLGRIPLDEESSCRRDLYLTTHNPHKRRKSMLPEGFEPAIPASEPHTHS